MFKLNKRRRLVWLVLFFLLMLLFNNIVITPVVSANYTYEDLEDWTEVNWDVIRRTGGNRCNVTMDYNSTMNGTTSLNISRDSSQEVSGDLSVLLNLSDRTPSIGNGIRPEQWSIKFNVTETNSVSYISILLCSDTTGSHFFNFYFRIWPSVNEFRVSNGTVANTHTYSMSFSYNVTYTLTLTNLTYPVGSKNTCDVMLDNGTTTEMIHAVEFMTATAGTQYFLSRVGISASSLPYTMQMYLDDWTIGTIAEATTGASSAVTSTTATLAGTVTDDGAGHTGGATAGFWYNTTDSLMESNSENISATGIYNSTDSYTADLTGLSPGEVYYYRAWVRNESGEQFVNDTTGEDNFFTLPFAPTGVTDTVVDRSTINISWTKGVGANQTLLVRKTTGMPIPTRKSPLQ